MFVGINRCDFFFALISLAVNSAGLQVVVADVPLAANVALDEPVPVEAVGAAQNQNQPQAKKAKVNKAGLDLVPDRAYRQLSVHAEEDDTHLEPEILLAIKAAAATASANGRVVRLPKRYLE